MAYQKQFLVVSLAALQVCTLFGAGQTSSTAQAPVIEQSEQVINRLSVVAVKNESNATFKVYYDTGACKGIVTPQSTLQMSSHDVVLAQNKLMQINCATGPYQPIYVQDGSKASGTAPAGYHGPYVLSLWLSYPQVSEKEKMYVSYVVAEHHIGEIMLVINQDGAVQVQTVQHVKIV